MALVTIKHYNDSAIIAANLKQQSPMSMNMLASHVVSGAIWRLTTSMTLTQDLRPIHFTACRHAYETHS